MHQNPAFRKTADDQNCHYARRRGFGILALNGEQGPLLSHIPFMLKESCAELHLTRSNPIAAIKEPTPAVMAVSGPDCYLSPDWYGEDDHVPTWNYIAVHLRGILHPLPHVDLRPMLDELSFEFERRYDKKPWHSSKMSAGVMDRMMRMILPFRLEIAKIDGTWKLSQNKSPDICARIIGQLTRQGGMAAEIAKQMEQTSKQG